MSTDDITQTDVGSTQPFEMIGQRLPHGDGALSGVQQIFGFSWDPKVCWLSSSELATGACNTPADSSSHPHSILKFNFNFFFSKHASKLIASFQILLLKFHMRILIHRVSCKSSSSHPPWFFSPKYLRRVANYENPKVKGGETVKRDVQIECMAGERTDWG